MINSIPETIYDNDGQQIRIVKTSVIYYKDRQVEGYVFHVEREERITSISEFDLLYKNDKYFVKRDVFHGFLEG